MNNRIYNITFSINREYLLFMCVTLSSLLKNNSKYHFNIYVIHNNGLEQAEIDSICDRFPLNQFSNFKIHLVDISHFEIVDNFKERGRWSKEIYFKLFTHLVLPNVDKILHLDADVLVIGDIKEFFDMDMEGLYFIGDKYRARNGVCAGVLMMNLAELRKIDVLKDLHRELLLNSELLEEDFFNKVYTKYIKNAPVDYIYTLPREDVLPEDVTKIIHYTTIKPYVLQRFKNKDLTTKGIKKYFIYLEDFIEPKYKWRFKLLKSYVFSCGSSLNSLERRVRWFWNKHILQKRNFFFKMNFFTKQIYKYSFIKKHKSKG